MQLIVITPEQSIEGETDLVNQMFANSLQRLHIRKPQYSSRNYEDYIGAIPAHYHSRIVLHASFELFDEFGLGGVHLNSHFRNDKQIWDKLRHLPPAALSTSFHSWQEIMENEFHFGYVFISPVFDSISKSGYKGKIDLNGAEETKQQLLMAGGYCPPIFALGGVGPKEILALCKHGFDGAAVLGSIWMANDPVAKFMEIENAVRSLSDP